MGDIPAEDGSQPTLGPSQTGQQDEGQLRIVSGTGDGNYSSSRDIQPSSDNPAFHSQLSSIPHAHQQRLESSRSPAQVVTSIPYGAGPESLSGQSHPISPFNMATMVGALPGVQPGHPSQHIPHQNQRGLSGASTSAVVYQLQQISQYPGQHPTTYQIPPQYGPNFIPGQFNTAYAPGQPMQSAIYAPYAQLQPRSVGPSPLQTNFPGHPQQNTQYMYYPGPHGPQPTIIHSHPAHIQPQQVAGYTRRSSLPTQLNQGYTQRMDGSILGGNYPQAGQIHPAVGFAVDYGMTGAVPVHGVGPVLTRTPSSDNSPASIPRGPPRKPKQSGHALWVGNLPPGTTVIELKDHFSRDATREIESLFLISKSNCAFVNYRTEESCTAAMQRFHDSRFKGVRLVCRLRRSSVPSSGVPTGPSAMSASRPRSVPPQESSLEEEVEEEERVDGEAGPAEQESSSIPHDDTATTTATTTVVVVDSDTTRAPKIPERFFIVKSLTLQDLELSVRNRIWATQSHNEESLNKAYQSAENVYLIFSANKSGEYFGYARMASPISEDATEILRTLPSADLNDSSDVPKTIPTVATEFAPKGRIIDDSARGTIFWEAELSDVEEDVAVVADTIMAVEEGEDPNAPSETWGKPFKIEWMSTTRLPFYRTRGLRNPWNANREVKIARDGTELETTVGRRLVQMFHKMTPPAVGPSGIHIMQMPPQQQPNIGGGPAMQSY